MIKYWQSMQDYALIRNRRMLMKRKIVNILLSAVLLSALFLTGCGNGGTAQSTKGAADSGLENSQSGEETEENACRNSQLLCNQLRHLNVISHKIVVFVMIGPGRPCPFHGNAKAAEA